MSLTPLADTISQATTTIIYHNAEHPNEDERTVTLPLSSQLTQDSSNIFRNSGPPRPEARNHAHQHTSLLQAPGGNRHDRLADAHAIRRHALAPMHCKTYRRHLAFWRPPVRCHQIARLAPYCQT